MRGLLFLWDEMNKKKTSGNEALQFVLSMLTWIRCFISYSNITVHYQLWAKQGMQKSVIHVYVCLCMHIHIYIFIFLCFHVEKRMTTIRKIEGKISNLNQNTLLTNISTLPLSQTCRVKAKRLKRNHKIWNKKTKGTNILKTRWKKTVKYQRVQTFGYMINKFLNSDGQHDDYS